MADGKRIKLPHNDDRRDFYSGDKANQVAVIEVSLAEYRQLAESKKLEILVGNVAIESYMKKPANV